MISGSNGFQFLIASFRLLLLDGGPRHHIHVRSVMSVSYKCFVDMSEFDSNFFSVQDSSIGDVVTD